jgi:hypothetical protein
VKAARKKKRRQLDAEGRTLRAFGRELDRKDGTWNVRPTKAVTVSEAQLLALGGSPRYETTPEKGKPLPPIVAIVFGRENDARMIFKPVGGGQWNVALEGIPSLEELRRLLSQAGRGLWDHAQQRPALAFRAVQALLSCERQFKGVPWGALPHFAVATMLDAIETTLEVLRQKQGRKLQIAFNLLTDNQWPQKLERLRTCATHLASELQRPPSKGELMKRFDPGERLEPSTFSRLLKDAGLAWLRREREAA